MSVIAERTTAIEYHERVVRQTRASIVPLSVWAVLVAIGAGSLAGGADFRGGVLLLLPIAIGVGVAFFGGRIASRARWRTLLLVAVIAAAAWAVSLALVDGAEALTRPLQNRYDYLHDVPLVGDAPGAFLETFTKRIRSLTTHVQGHPPGALLTFWLLDRAGLGGAGWAAALVIGAGASAAAASLIALREVAGESIARRAAPFLALTPAAIWIATSADALFLGVSAWSIALFAVATGRTGARSDALAIAGGTALGAALFLSYGVVPLAALLVAIAIARRGLRPLLVAAAGVTVVVGAFALAGFWWLDGARASVERYAAGAARHRSYASAIVTNLGTFAVALGPATAVALTRLRGKRVWLLVGAAIAAIGIANLSGLSKGEVERIWLPFVPWIMTACVALAGRGWLGLQAATAVVVQVVLRSPW